ncbi:MAG: HlyD family secretion protein [Methylacidiphilales bacterium]|nr:HlyD family secretion protein [Candidatus Methylacidiphilales bacterium]
MRLPTLPHLRVPYLPELGDVAPRRYLLTGAAVLLAFLLAWALWWHYLRSPWTRDGRVRAEVVNIAAEISGKVVDLDVVDNQTVKKGDILFEIDPVDYRLALTQAESSVQSRQYDQQVAEEDSERRQKLGAQAVSAEERNTSLSTAHVAEAAYQAALAARDQARVNLDRTIIRSPVNGYVTNLILRVGDYATPGQTKMTLVDSDSFWVAGYFEETKLPNIHVGDYAHVRLMGWGPEIAGHVESISRAIADDNSDPNYEGLADVSPIFTWVRLAQRLPVRIKIDRVPDNVTLAAGQTCTIVLGPARKP